MGSLPGGFTFPGSGLRLESDARGWRLTLPGEYAALTPEQELLSYAPPPERLLDGYTARPAHAPDFVIAFGRVTESDQISALTAIAGSDPETGKPLLSARALADCPADLTWHVAPSYVVHGGVWAAEVPFEHQWLQITVSGTAHRWFRPIRHWDLTNRTP